MRIRHALALAALAFLLSACGSESITAPEKRADDASPAAGIGWAGGGGRTADPSGGQT